MKQRGIKDIALVSTGELTNGISLGVYSQPNSAKTRAANIRKAGYSKADTRTQTGRLRYWQIKGDGKAPWKSLQAKISWVRILERGC